MNVRVLMLAVFVGLSSLGDGGGPGDEERG